MGVLNHLLFHYLYQAFNLRVNGIILAPAPKTCCFDFLSTAFVYLRKTVKFLHKTKIIILERSKSLYVSLRPKKHSDMISAWLNL